MNVRATASLDELIESGQLIYFCAAGRYGFLMAYLVIGTFVGVTFGSLVAVLVPLVLTMLGWQNLPFLLPLLLAAVEVVAGISGLWLGANYANGRYGMRYVNSLIALGAPRESEYAYALSEQGISIASESIHHFVCWGGLLEIAPTSKFWLLITGATNFILPKNAFSTQQEEREFIANVLGQMSPNASDRSVEARAFVGRT